ncbi:MAG TPA: HNH endonuclease signature motif containing protein, partial [Candidatus Dormibacteraeota bacterium]|nr:HNH endonuclease signature motif containing protein [Candidatus Dormibacteraeota bacterium]
ALNARDRHCRWPGCERPAGWCDGHHLKPWIQGGSSDLENLTLLCGRHHRLVHEGGWQLIKTEDGRLLTIAPPTTFRLARAPD